MSDALDKIIDHRLDQMDRNLAARDSNYCRFELAAVAKEYMDYMLFQYQEAIIDKDARIAQLESALAERHMAIHLSEVVRCSMSKSMMVPTFSEHPMLVKEQK